MANNKLPSAIQEELTLTVGELMEKVNKELAEKDNKIKLDLAKKREEALAKYTLELKLKNENISLEELKIKQEQFLNVFKAREHKESLRIQEEQNKQAMKDLIAHHKEKSKLADKERKKEQKQLEQELEVAKLRSQFKEDGSEKGGLEKFADNLSADLKENLSMMGDSFKDVGKGMIKGLANLGDKLSGEINAVISSYSKYQSSINTRLQGATETFQSVEKTLTSTLGMTPYFRTENMLEKLNELVGAGIAYNLEQRAFLGTVSEKIATTFDVANASLLRIVKLQQSDSSASRLGMEAYLTRFFNNMFKDTAYLTESFDNVSAALLEATAMMSADMAVEFEYIVQKWLGSLSAVGMSQSTIQGLAEAIGYMGSGNISALSGSNFQNILVMAASKANVDYSRVLTEGLDAYSANKLLEAVVAYMHEIGSGSSKVVKSQFAQTFGLSVSDLQAAGNLRVEDINVLTKSLMSYQGTIEELGYQLDQVGTRTSIAEKIENMMKNIKFGIGQGIAQSPVMAGMWSITDLIQSVTGGINIPKISVLGTGVDLNTTVENLVKLGLVGASTFGKLGDLFTGLSNAGQMSNLISRYGLGALTTTERGTGLPSRDRGMSTSQSAYVGAGGGGDIARSAQIEAQYAVEGDIKAKQGEQKGPHDIFGYLVNLLDPKLSKITHYLGSMAGYSLVANLPSVSEEGAIEERRRILEMGTTVMAATGVETHADKQLNIISSIDENVTKIFNLLAAGITINATSSLGDTIAGIN